MSVVPPLRKAEYLNKVATPLLILLLVSGVFSDSVAAKGTVTTSLLLKKTEMATPVHVLDSGTPGDVLLVIGGIHGNEPAGMEAAKQLLALRPSKGKMVIIPIANRLAAEAGMRSPYYMPDLNRAFPGRNRGNNTEKLAASIMGVIRRYRPAAVIDLHEADPTTDPGSTETANSLILSEDGRAAVIGLHVLETRNAEAQGRSFSFLSSAPEGSLNHEVSRRLKIPVITVETDKRDLLANRVATQLDMVKRIAKAVEEHGK